MFRRVAGRLRDLYTIGGLCLVSARHRCRGRILDTSGPIEVNELALGGVMDPPKHVSYSQFAEWAKCGKAYELRRILGLAESPAWWSIGGHGVHAATEQFDRESVGK